MSIPIASVPEAVYATAVAPGGAPSLDVPLLGAFLTALLTLFFLKERRTHGWCELALGLCCGHLAVMTTFAGAWPAGMVLGAFAAVSIRQWRILRKSVSSPLLAQTSARGSVSPNERVSRLFGPPAPIPPQVRDN